MGALLRLGSKPAPARALIRRPLSARQSAVVTRCGAGKRGGRVAKGTQLKADDLEVGVAVGEGSFGQVFKVRGTGRARERGREERRVSQARPRPPLPPPPLARRPPPAAAHPPPAARRPPPAARRTPQGTLARSGAAPRSVVLKRVKDRVPGAAEMAEMEHVLNVYASAAAPRAVAPFLGFALSGGRGRLTRGLWLAWAFEGRNDLAYYLKRRDCLAALAEDMDVSEADVVPTVMGQLFACLADLHAAGLVHRDVKPANFVLADAARRFKLVDLGAAADLRTGTNFAPAETILDPQYCPPEQVRAEQWNQYT
jgi:serine/threonine protein kinase